MNFTALLRMFEGRSIAGVPVILQSRFDRQFVQEADTNTVIVVGAVIVGFIVVLVIAGSLSSRKGTVASSGTTRYRPRLFKRRAKLLGLSKTHIRTLEYVRDRYHVRNPMALLSNSRQLDFYLNKAIVDIEQQVADDNVKEAQKLTLFRIKQIIERNVHKTGALNSTKQLRPGQQLSVSVNEGRQYRSRLLAVLRDGLAIEMPSNEDGSQVRWKKWTLVTTHLWKPNGEGFAFNSKVTGYNKFKGTPAAFIQHSSKIQSSKQRRFRRKRLENPCYFYPVRVLTLGRGRNQQRKAYIEKNRGVLGTIEEVSAGGCSIRAARTLGKASLIKVDFETDRGTSISSFGKVVDTRKDEGFGAVMHVMFTRVSKQNLNRINSYIYEYGGEPARV